MIYLFVPAGRQAGRHSDSFDHYVRQSQRNAIYRSDAPRRVALWFLQVFGTHTHHPKRLKTFWSGTLVIAKFFNVRRYSTSDGKLTKL